ncbi:MAG: hypothetical protein D6826_10360, partial [Alphaproteobacteria bacterium]
MTVQSLPTGAVTYALGTLAYLVLLPGLLRRGERLDAILFIAAVGTSAAWTAATALHYAGWWDGARVVAGLEVARLVGWQVLLAAVIWVRGGPRPRLLARRHVVAALGGIAAAGLAVALLPWAVDPLGVVVPRAVVGLVLAVAGLVLTETLFRNTTPDQRWQIKFLCLAVGLICAYDMFFYAEAMLFG